MALGTPVKCWAVADIFLGLLVETVTPLWIKFTQTLARYMYMHVHVTCSTCACTCMYVQQLYYYYMYIFNTLLCIWGS